MEDLIRRLTQEPIFIILGLVVLGLAALHFATRSRRRWTGPIPDPLVTACLGDRKKADRLVHYELKRTPGISHSQARRRAHDRLTDDRR